MRGYQRELAWVGEGFTDYMAGRSLHDAGVWSDRDFESFLTDLRVRYVEGVAERPASLQEASALAWDDGRYWEQVYTGGAVVAAELDTWWLTGEPRTHGSFDALFARVYALPGGASVTDLEMVFQECFGHDLAARTREWVRGELPVP